MFATPLGVGFDLFGQGGQFGHRNTQGGREVLGRMPSGVGLSELNEGKGLGREASLLGEADLRCTAFDPKLANRQSEGGLGVFRAPHARQTLSKTGPDDQAMDYGQVLNQKLD